MTGERVKRGWDFDPDLVDGFDRFIDASGMQKNAAAELGLWLVMNLPPELLARLRVMQVRDMGCLLEDLKVLTWDEQMILLAYRRVTAEAKVRIADLARREVAVDEAHRRQAMEPEAVQPPPMPARGGGAVASGAAGRDAGGLVDQAEGRTGQRPSSRPGPRGERREGRRGAG